MSTSTESGNAQCPNCYSLSLQLENALGNLRCQAATNLAMRREQERTRDQYRADILRWANTERVGVALEELAEAPAMDMRVKQALVADTHFPPPRRSPSTPGSPVDGTDSDARFDSERGDP